MCWELFCLRCDELEIKINNLLSEHMFVCRTAGFIYWNKSSKLAKSFFKNADCLDAFDLQGDYRICEAFLNGRWSGFAYWDEWTKMHNPLINKLIIIIHLDYLQWMEMHEIVW